MPGREPRIGLAVSTVGRPAISDLLASAAASRVRPAAVAIANQSGDRLDVDPADYPFEVVVVPSRGGLSAGRNDAVAALPSTVELVGFPNDDSTYPPDVLGTVARLVAEKGVDGVACTYLATDRPELPPDGILVDRRTVWRVGEPGLFLSLRTLNAAGGFATDLGTGSPSPWQSGEGTDVLLTVLAQGGRIMAAPSVHVNGPGERRDLSDRDYLRKVRGYARGTGAVYRRHGYGPVDVARTLIGPWRRVRSDPLSVRVAWARTTGRVEGLLGRTLSSRRDDR